MEEERRVTCVNVSVWNGAYQVDVECASSRRERPVSSDVTEARVCEDLRSGAERRAVGSLSVPSRCLMSLMWKRKEEKE